MSDFNELGLVNAINSMSESNRNSRQTVVNAVVYSVGLYWTEIDKETKGLQRNIKHINMVLATMLQQSMNTEIDYAMSVYATVIPHIFHKDKGLFGKTNGDLVEFEKTWKIKMLLVEQTGFVIIGKGDTAKPKQTMDLEKLKSRGTSLVTAWIKSNTDGESFPLSVLAESIEKACISKDLIVDNGLHNKKIDTKINKMVEERTQRAVLANNSHHAATVKDMLDKSREKKLQRVKPAKRV